MEILVIKRREPFEIVFLALLLLASGTQVLIGTTPGTIAALLPGWLALMWASLTLVGSATGLLGIAIPGAVTGIFMERVGLSICAYVLFIYSASILVIGGARGFTASALCLAISVAFLMRNREISQVIKKLPRTAPD